MNDQDLKTIQAMRTYGGEFVQRLAWAAMAADPTNVQKLKDAFPAYWARYERMAKAAEVAP